MLQSNSLLVLNGKKHVLSRVVTLGMGGPVIKIKPEELNLWAEHHAEYTNAADADDGKLIIVYKQNGKFTVLFGNETMQDRISKLKPGGLLSCHLMSTIMLKKAREDE